MPGPPQVVLHCLHRAGASACGRHWDVAGYPERVCLGGLDGYQQVTAG